MRGAAGRHRVNAALAAMAIASIAPLAWMVSVRS